MNPSKHPGVVLEFEEYVRTRQGALLRSARRMVGDPLDAQDLLQTALLRTYHRWEHIADKRLADAYLRRVMINTRTGWWRTRKLQELPTDRLPDASVEDWAEQHADRALLMDIIKTLPPRQLSVLVLRYWEQMSTDETATALGMAPGTVKSTLRRALAQLRQELQHRDPDSPSTTAGTASPPTGHQPRSLRRTHRIPAAHGHGGSNATRTAVRSLQAGGAGGGAGPVAGPALEVADAAEESGQAACLPDVACGPVIVREKTPEARIPSPSPGRPAPPTNLDLSADNQQRHSIVF
ncbi:SigE family RNA polymerase sigma factor [Streptomyces mirabilis]